MDANTIYRDISLLHPKMSGVATGLAKDLVRGYETGRTKFKFEIFETFRSPVRQLSLKAKGTSKAGPWQSPHQFGLAIDFVPFLSAEEARAESTIRGRKILPGWFWPEIGEQPWSFLKERANLFGVEQPIAWDKPHIEHPLWLQVQKALKGPEGPSQSGL